MTMRTTVTAALVVLLTAPALADTIRVPGDHATIQAAVDAAGNGDEIQIRGGTYAEAIVVMDTADLTIIGKRGATIEPPGSDEGITAQNCVGLVIKGLRFEGGGRGILVSGCDNARIEKCRSSDNQNGGFEIRASQNVTVTKCRVEGGQGEGIKFGDGNPDQQVTGGEVSKCRVRDVSGDGFRINANGSTISKCRCDGAESGFDVEDASQGVTVEKCRSFDVSDEAFKTNAPGTNFVKCLAKDADEEGYDVEADMCEVEKCKAIDCRRGIEFEGVTSGMAANCKLIKCREVGVALFGATGVTVEGCLSKKAGDFGFHVRDDSNTNTLTKNKGVKNGEADLRDENGEGSNTYTDNKFKVEDFSSP